jgi:ribonucleoside-diphosphate reductase alpha chain
MLAIGFMSLEDAFDAAVAEMQEPGSVERKRPLGKICPKCGQPTLIKSEGCEKCLCGFSKCG